MKVYVVEYWLGVGDTESIFVGCSLESAEQYARKFLAASWDQPVEEVDTPLTETKVLRWGVDADDYQNTRVWVMYDLITIIEFEVK